MPEFEQIYQDIDALPTEAKVLLFDFVQLLKRLHLPSQPEPQTPKQSVYARFEEAGLIGCCDVEEELSTTYKDVLLDILATQLDRSVFSAAPGKRAQT